MSPNGLWSAEARTLPAYEVAVYLPRMLERNQAMVTRRGIEFGGLVFDRPDDAVFARMKAQATSPGGPFPIAIHFDRMISRQIYIASRRLSDPVITVPRSRISRQWEGYSFPEVEAATRAAAEKGQATENKYIQAKIDYSILVDEAVADAADQIAAKYGAKGPPLDLKEVARKDQQDRQIEEEAKLLPPAPAAPGPESSATIVPATATASASPETSLASGGTTPSKIVQPPEPRSGATPSATPPEPDQPPVEPSLLPQY
jgi:hypothetical protein